MTRKIFDMMATPVPSTMFGFGITVDNVNEALPLGLDLVRTHGVAAESRGLEVLRVPGPVQTIYRTPVRRVLFDEVRDANPFFHLIECLWILAGDNRLELPRMFLNGYAQYSDNQKTLHGAYGHRLRAHFGFDQLNRAVKLLRDKPDTRQCVLSIWDPRADLAVDTKDMPCNDMIMLDIVDSRLNMTVCNRSNDVIWGAYGANAVHFSFLQEWLAAMIGVHVGNYVQMSNNYHVYLSNPFWQKYMEGNHDSGHVFNPYMLSHDIGTWPIALDTLQAEEVATDAYRLCLRAQGNPDSLAALVHDHHYTSDFFNGVIVNVILGYMAYQNKDWDAAQSMLDSVQASDWRYACKAWVLRRQQRAAMKEKARA